VSEKIMTKSTDYESIGAASGQRADWRRMKSVMQSWAAKMMDSGMFGAGLSPIWA
jgi:hypothetical protein